MTQPMVEAGRKTGTSKPPTAGFRLMAGERVLLPRVRAADRDCLVLADGFSCREQIEQGAGRKTHHLAEIIAENM